LNLDEKIRLKRLVLPLDKAVETATHARQEILEAALAEKNSTTALKLAEMEYLPNYTVGYEFDYILQSGAQPLPTVTQGNTFSIGFNIPIFFWIHQREDVHAVQHSLQAARYSMHSVLSQTEATVTQLYQSASMVLGQPNFVSSACERQAWQYLGGGHPRRSRAGICARFWFH
jgi:outer membrane protein TolC